MVELWFAYEKYVWLSDLPEKVRERWNGFVTGKLADVNKQNLSELVSEMYTIHRQSRMFART